MKAPKDAGGNDVKTVDCSRHVVAAGVDAKQTGQQVEVHYQPVDKPEGEFESMWLRANHWYQMRGDTSIFFEDDDGDEYGFIPRSVVEEREIAGIPLCKSDEHRLYKRDGGEMTLIGTNISFSIPENRLISPMLKEGVEHESE